MGFIIIHIIYLYEWGDSILIQGKQLELVQVNTLPGILYIQTEPLLKLRGYTHQTGGMPWFLRAQQAVDRTRC